MHNNPNNVKISVICPSYNSAEFISKTLASVVLQTLQPFELLISDDGSTDGTRDVVAGFVAMHPELSIRLIENPHRGPGAARNSGILNSAGDWIAFIDSDDIWLPDKLEVVSQSVQKNPKINFICNAEEHIKLDGSRQTLDYGVWYQADKNLLKQLYRRNFFSTSAVVCKKQLLLETGLFDEKLMSSQDYELWLRMAPKIKPYFIRETLGLYYDRSGNISTQKMWRRLKNILIISACFRHQVGTAAFFHKILRVSGSMGLQSWMSFWNFK